MPDQMPPIRIRAATRSDAAAIARLMRDLGYAATEMQIADRLDHLLPLNTHCILIADTAGNPAGWIAAERRMILESGERVEIVGLVVASAARRHGVGRRLVAAVESWTADQGLAIIFVRSNVVRAESHSFYTGIGYVRTKTQHAYVRDLGTP